MVLDSSNRSRGSRPRAPWEAAGYGRRTASARDFGRRRYPTADFGRSPRLAYDGGRDGYDGPGARPWRRRAYDAGPPERRRGPDRRQQPERRRDVRERWHRIRERARDRGWIERGREFLRRYREPIIGLTIAGAAAPIARGAREAPRPAPREVEEPTPAPRAAPGAIEDEVAEQWAIRRAEQRRADTIEGAVLRYDIGRGLAADIYDAAIETGIDPDVAFGLVHTESAFDHRAVSNVGARGLTQLMPGTARWLRPGTTASDLFDRNLNLRMGFSYLRDLIDKYDGNLRLALLAYNRGPGTVDRILDRGGDPDNGYADMVLSG
ncbi:MAG TPA: transglycosylase SLT domain-containing protein [Longimicrobiales bacterium]